MWRTIALSLLLLGLSFPVAFAAEPSDNASSDRARSDVQGLLQMGKPEDAFLRCVTAAQSDPGSAAALHDLAAQSLSQARASLTIVPSSQADTPQKKNVINPLPMTMIKKVWPALIAPSSATLFASKDEYDKAVNDFYQVMVNYTFNLAQTYQNKGNLQQALFMADYCIAYKPAAPDPRAVQLRADLQKQIAQAAPGVDSHNPLVAPTGGGEEFRLQAPEDDGTVHDNPASPELMLGSSRYPSELVFPNVQIPKGAHIKSAKLRGYYLKPLPWAKPPFETKIYGEDTDNAQVLNTQTTAIDKRAPMQPMIYWPIAEPAEGWVESPDITKVIQTIVNRPGWAMGHNLGLLIIGIGRGPADFISFEQDPQRAFRLVVDWQ